MKTITITINCDNAAFGETATENEIEVSRILFALGDRILKGERPSSSKDCNGNTCASVDYVYNGKKRTR
jgi:hypothetical protein